MTAQPLSLLLTDVEPAARAALIGAGFAVAEASAPSLAAPLIEHDAWLIGAASAAALAALALHVGLPQAVFDTPVVVVTHAADETLEADLLRLGVEAIVHADEGGAALARAVRHAVLRKRVERAARTAYATDLATGLPHQAQLLEHMTQLLALREREPMPMVLLVLRIEGYAGAAARLGAETANILRRKVAVRLRSGLRASDVVAAIGADSFGVLLPHLEALADGERVAAKLVRALNAPLVVAGHPTKVIAAIGMALYPTHGKDAESLLRRASAQAGTTPTLGQEGFAMQAPQGGGAANDDAH